MTSADNKPAKAQKQWRTFCSALEGLELNFINSTVNQAIMHNLHILPKPLRKELKEVAGECESVGIKLVLFGSFATGIARLTSDLDLAYDSDKIEPEYLKQLHDRIDDLHTIRTVDLIDLQKVDPGVAQEIKNNGRLLSECLVD